jgi:hypothetical protein
MTFLELKNEVAFHAADPTMKSLTSAHYGQCINDAVCDLTMVGWLTPMSVDRTILMVEGTYDYAIPANTAYIYQLNEESPSVPTVYDIEVPLHQWSIKLVAGTPYISFDSDLWYARAGYHIEILSQRRPVTYATDATTVEALFESFLRERATYYALMLRAMIPEPNRMKVVQQMEGESPPGTRRPPEASVPDQVKVFLAVAQQRFVNSERMLAYHPSEFRVQPNGVNVPGR